MVLICESFLSTPRANSLLCTSRSLFLASSIAPAASYGNYLFAHPLVSSSLSRDCGFPALRPASRNKGWHLVDLGKSLLNETQDESMKRRKQREKRRRLSRDFTVLTQTCVCFDIWSFKGRLASRVCWMLRNKVASCPSNP